MTLIKAIVGGAVAALASSSMALATCGSVCLVECEGEYGTDWQICYHGCYHNCTNQGPPGGS